MPRESDLARARRWCESRVPAGVSTRVWVELEASPSGAVVVERHRPLIGAMRSTVQRREVARLRHSRHSGWTLEWRQDAHWRRYSRLAPTPDIEVVLEELDHDPCGVFWSGHGGGSGGEERRRDVALA